MVKLPCTFATDMPKKTKKKKKTRTEPIIPPSLIPNPIYPSFLGSIMRFASLDLNLISWLRSVPASVAATGEMHIGFNGRVNTHLIRMSASASPPHPPTPHHPTHTNTYYFAQPLNPKTQASVWNRNQTRAFMQGERYICLYVWMK